MSNLGSPHEVVAAKQPNDPQNKELQAGHLQEVLIHMQADRCKY